MSTMVFVRFAAAAAAIALFLASRPVAAQATYPTSYLAIPIASSAKVFAAVDSVALLNNRVIVTGVIQGEAIASSWTVYASSSDPTGWASACERKALLAMSRPGEYLLEIQQLSAPYVVCKLSRVTP